MVNQLAETAAVFIWAVAVPVGGRNQYPNNSRRVILNVTTEFVQTIDYCELQKGIKEILGIDYEIVAMEEACNDSTLRFNLEYNDSWRAGEAVRIEETKIAPQYSLGTLLHMLMWHGHLKPGVVNVNIFW